MSPRTDRGPKGVLSPQGGYVWTGKPGTPQPRDPDVPPPIDEALEAYR